MRGRAREGLLDRIFRRDLILKFVDAELVAEDRSGVVGRLLELHRDAVIRVVDEGVVQFVVEAVVEGERRRVKVQIRLVSS